MRAAILILIFALARTATADEVLLVPDAATDTVGRYDSYSGDYLGDLIVDPDPTSLGWLDTPVHAIRGPDDLLYVSDQTRDAVVRFTAAGEFVDVFADAADGLDNPRGLEFLNGDLLVCYAPAPPLPPGIARFTPAGLRRSDYAGGADCFDVFSTAAGVIVSDIANDRVDLLDPDTGEPLSTLALTDFPEQIARKRGGNLLVIAYLGNEIIELTPEGAIVRRLPITNLGRGIAELGNGNLLITSGAGIRELNPTTGAVLRTVRAGMGFRFIERVNFGSDCVYAGCDAGDVTADCVVDLTDLSVLLTEFGAESHGPSDLNGDGVVDLADLSQLLGVFGNDCR